jgi:uncharacterized membrane protein
MNKIWFKAKRYGWGWYPATWQGWLVLLVWIVLFFLTMLRLEDATSFREILSEVVVPVVLEVALLIMLSWGTGEKPRWRWGN